ncbi:MAG: gfo/Idh/MocA family oxidoreductase [Dactylosporangium sp.]|jgi:predicted dehydrogenase|nr:gfo/Idh/MocA family oxidoreductase [Dactylosporangium sp.]
MNGSGMGEQPVAPVGVAIVGLGAAGRQHLRALTGTPAAELRAVCDADPARVAALAGELEKAEPLDWEGVLAAPDVDVVALCTPPGARAALAAAALAAGKAVLVEKPPVRTEAELDELLIAARSARRPVGVMLQHRFRLPADALDATWSPRAVGVLEVVRHRPVGHYAREAWRLDPDAAGGGLFAHLAVHYTDLACQLLGDPVEVSGLVDCDLVPGVDTRLALTVRFGSGAVLTLVGTTAIDARGERLAVYDDGQVFTVHDGAPRLIRDAHEEAVAAVPTADLRTAVYDEFCRAVASGTEPARTALARSRGVVRIVERVGRLAA